MQRAIIEDDIKEVKRLLTREIVAIKTALFYVQSFEMAEFLISQGADVNSKNRMGGTVLHDVRDVEMARLFIENGADMNAKDDYGDTPLHYVEEDIEMVRLFIENGADVNAQNKDGETPYDLASLYSPKELKKYLRSQGGLTKEELEAQSLNSPKEKEEVSSP